jgi:hypothetical protein
MKKSSLILLTLVLAVSLLAQTEYLGDGVFVQTPGHQVGEEQL